MICAAAFFAFVIQGHEEKSRITLKPQHFPLSPRTAIGHRSLIPEPTSEQRRASISA